MTTILENLYLGDFEDACNTDKLKETKISYILTVDVKPLPLEKHQNFTYKYIHALDMEETDLLGHFDDAIAFIESGRKAGGVLVHCFAGQSRSSTIVLAYLMHKLDMELCDSIVLLRKLCPQSSPNAGFLSQLEIFEAMGNKIDKSNNEYKMYKLSALALKMQSAQKEDYLQSDILSADPSLTTASGECVYKCRKCRRPLFRGSGVLSHMTGLGEVAFHQWKSHQTEASESHTECSMSLFIEPVCWMSREILHLDGKLSCPKCQAKIGSFNWFGERCPCGTWITPAFHIQTGKVDECKPQVRIQRLHHKTYALSTECSKDQTQNVSNVISLTKVDKVQGSSENIDLPPLDT